MAEKRFTFADGFKIVAIKDNGKIMNSKQVCNQLNELAEENNQLKQEIKGFEGCSHNWGLLYDEAKNKVEELSKENQELKQLIGVIHDLIDGYIAIADDYRKPIESLTIGDELGYWNGVYQYMKKLKKRMVIK